MVLVVFGRTEEVAYQDMQEPLAFSTRRRNQSTTVAMLPNVVTGKVTVPIYPCLKLIS